ncbi:MAG: PIN domain-containing protein [Phycisphaerales bacterium]|nr:PIN domain-containing protein [Phycisphaerales bacterium]
MGKGETLFLDTVALLALVNRDDELHERCERIWREHVADGSRFITSEWVLGEFLGGASRRPLREAACRIVDRLARSERTAIVPASHERWIAAYELFRSRSDKEWSFVDCGSILVCQELGVGQVFTRDRHFVQAGLRVLIE